MTTSKDSTMQAIENVSGLRKYLEDFDFTQTEMAQEYKAKFYKKVKQSECNFGLSFNDDTLRVFQEMYSDGLNDGAVVGMTIMLAQLRRAGISLQSLVGSLA